MVKGKWWNMQESTNQGNHHLPFGEKRLRAELILIETLKPPAASARHSPANQRKEPKGFPQDSNGMDWGFHVNIFSSGVSLLRSTPFFLRFVGETDGNEDK